SWMDRDLGLNRGNERNGEMIYGNRSTAAPLRPARILPGLITAGRSQHPVLRVTNAILPTMRQAGHGRIVNISSVVGFVPAPYMGMYAASKHAVEGYTETLDHEVRRFGVRAILVQPAYTKSKINGNSRSAKVALEV